MYNIYNIPLMLSHSSTPFTLIVLKAKWCFCCPLQMKKGPQNISLVQEYPALQEHYCQGFTSNSEEQRGAGFFHHTTLLPITCRLIVKKKGGKRCRRGTGDWQDILEGHLVLEPEGHGGMIKLLNHSRCGLGTLGLSSEACFFTLEGM